MIRLRESSGEEKLLSCLRLPCVTCFPSQHCHVLAASYSIACFGPSRLTCVDRNYWINKVSVNGILERVA